MRNAKTTNKKANNRGEGNVTYTTHKKYITA